MKPFSDEGIANLKATTEFAVWLAEQHNRSDAVIGLEPRKYSPVRPKVFWSRRGWLYVLRSVVSKEEVSKVGNPLRICSYDS